MKYFIALTLTLFSLAQLNAQTEQSISPDNPVYMEWVSENGFKFLTVFKDGENVLDRTEVEDVDGNSIPSDVTSETFEISKYDFSTVIAPERNTLIKISDDLAIFIYSYDRQNVLFSRYLINKAAKSGK